MSAAVLGLAGRASAALPPITVQVPIPTAIEAAQAATSNAVRAAAVVRLPRTLQAATANATTTLLGPSTNGQRSVTITLPNQLAAVAATRASDSQSAEAAAIAAPAMQATTSLQQMYGSGTCVRAGSGLVGWWQGERDADDSIGINHAQLVNGVCFDTGMVGQGFCLDGISQSVQIPYSTNLATPGFSMETWVFPCSQIAGQAFIFGQSYGRQLVVQPGAAGLRVALYITDPDGNWISATSDDEITVGDWTHLAGTWDGTYLNLYTNGVLAAQTMPEVPGIGDCACPFSIGGINDSCDYFGQYFPGVIDEVSLYDRALFGGEIYAIYQAGSAGKCKSSSTCFTCPDTAVSWWAAEGDASDAFRRNTGTLQNGAGFASGVAGQAFTFDGVSQAVRIPYAPSLTSAAFSVEAWVNPTGQVSQAFVFGQSYGRQLIVRVGNQGLFVAFVVSTDPWTFFEVVGSGEISLGQWTHLVGSWDGVSSLSLYVNGALDQQATLGIVPSDSGCPFSIGGINDSCGYSGQYFPGLIDEVTLYNTALPPDQVQAIYNAGTAGKCNIPGAWLEQYFGANYRTNPEAALYADPDDDGLTNWHEYILGRNPTVHGSATDSGNLINLQIFTPLR